MEPDRASLVRADQLELGRPPVALLGHYARLPPRHQDRDRPDRSRRPPRRRLSDRRIRLRCRHGHPQPPTPRHLPSLELHPATTLNHHSRPSSRQPESGTCCLTIPMWTHSWLSLIFGESVSPRGVKAATSARQLDDHDLTFFLRFAPTPMA